MKNMTNLAGAMFFMCITQFMGPYMMTTATFQNERPVFLREYANKMYTVFPYYVAKVLSDIPAFIISPLVFTLMTYFTIGFTISTLQFFGFYVSLAMCTLAAISFGYMISTAFSSPATALQIAPIVVMPLLLVGGFFSNAGTMPLYIEIFSYISPFLYAFNNLSKLEFSNNPSPAAANMLAFLSIEREFYMGIVYLAILTIVVQLLSFILLRVLVEKFQ